MPCAGLAITGSVISCLDYSVLWDISGATPSVTITNNSTVLIPAGTKWWFYVTTPSGVAVYGVDLNSLSVLPTPDVNGANWTTKTFNLPIPFAGNTQIEFSNSSPYSVTVFVADDPTLNPNPFYSLTKTQVICRPNGNTENTFGNFGAASLGVQVQCQNAKVLGTDKTNYAYQSLLGTPQSQSWTLVYPKDVNGNLPTPATATNAAYVLFPINYTGEGYAIYLNTFATYVFSNGSSVKIQYKSQTNPYQKVAFAVWCNINLCHLATEIQKLHQLAQRKCGQVEYPELMNKISQINLLLHQVHIGIEQPMCGIDVPKIIKEIERLGNFDCNCCGDTGVNFGNAIPIPTSSGCCPQFVSVIDINTGIAPANCPNGYFPATVYAPDGTTPIGVANSIGDEIMIINSNAAWQVYGTAFDAGNCKVGFFAANGGTIIPIVVVDPGTGGTGGGTIITDIIDITTGIKPTTCPGSYFPAQVYDPTGTTIIGVAYDINQEIGILNANTAWQAYGTAIVKDNCSVLWLPAKGVNTIPDIKIRWNGTITTGCTNGSQLYPVSLQDMCYPLVTTITSTSYPLNIYVDFGLGAGLEFVGNATNQSDMLAKLNAFSSKPASVTFTAGGTADQVTVTNTDCTAYNGVISLTADAGSNSFLLYAANHLNISSGSTTSASNAEYAMAIKTLTKLGKINGSGTNPTHGLWHTIQIANYLLATEPSTGKVWFWDITNPRNPTFVRVIQLRTVDAGNFAGIPHSQTLATGATSIPYTIATQYSLYFPTDYFPAMSLNAIYVVEALTGSIWKIDLFDTGTGVIAGFQDDQLIGKCPRILVNGLLYFTQDGDLEQATSQTSGVAIGAIVVLDTSDFTGTGLSVRTIIDNNVEYVWAASFDGVDTIYFTGNKTSVVTYAVSTDSRTTVYLYVAGVGINMTYRVNSVYYLGQLYVTPQYMPVFVGMIIDTATLGGVVTIGQFQQPAGANITGLFNFKPLGNCMGVLTSATVNPNLAIVGLYLLDGTYLSKIPLATEEEFYNVVPIPNVAVYTPNNFVP